MYEKIETEKEITEIINDIEELQMEELETSLYVAKALHAEYHY